MCVGATPIAPGALCFGAALAGHSRHRAVTRLVDLSSSVAAACAMADGKTAAQRAFEADQQSQMMAYQQTMTLLQTDALRAQEAQQRLSLEALRTDTERKTERVKSLKEKALLISAENVSKQELVDSMGTRLSDLSAELSRFTTLQLRQQKAGRTEDEKEAALLTVFEATMERATDRRSDGGGGSSSSASTAQQKQWLQQQQGPRTTPVYCCPGGETKASSLASATIRLGKATTFREVSANAARFFGMPPERCVLEDDNGTLWPLDVTVSREIARYRGEQVRSSRPRISHRAMPILSPALACSRLLSPALTLSGLLCSGLLSPGLACSGLLWPALSCSGLLSPALACSGLLWPALTCSHLVWPALAFRGVQVLRLVRREEHDMRGLADGGYGGGGGEEEEEEGVGASALVRMLNNGGGGSGDGAKVGGEGGGGEGGEDGGEGDEDAEQQAALEALAALDGDESDSDDENQQRKEYAEPHLPYRPWRHTWQARPHIPPVAPHVCLPPTTPR